jgi:hypothetical protein
MDSTVLSRDCRWAVFEYVDRPSGNSWNMREIESFSESVVHMKPVSFINTGDYYYYRISHFSALAGKYSPILGCSNQHD